MMRTEIWTDEIRFKVPKELFDKALLKKRKLSWGQYIIPLIEADLGNKEPKVPIKKASEETLRAIDEELAKSLLEERGNPY